MLAGHSPHQYTRDRLYHATDQGPCSPWPSTSHHFCRLCRRLPCLCQGPQCLAWPPAGSQKNCCTLHRCRLFPAFHFVPTRINPGDCPTRDLPLPPPSQASFWASLSHDELYETLASKKLRRWASNWARLVLLLSGASPASRPHLGWRRFHRASKGFDPTLGFPGEGPFFRVVLFGAWFLSVLAGPSHVLCPRHAADEKRSKARSVLVLAEGRPVEKVTQKDFFSPFLIGFQIRTSFSRTFST